MKITRYGMSNCINVAPTPNVARMEQRYRRIGRFAPEDEPKYGLNIRFKIWEGRNGESMHDRVPTFGVAVGSNRYKEQIWYSSLVRSRNEPPAMTVERSRNEPPAMTGVASQ